MGLKTGPDLVVDAMLSYQLFGMPDFWQAGPAGLLDDLKDAAQVALNTALAIAMGKACAGCTTVKSAMLPAHNAVWARVARAQASGVDVNGLADLIALKRGYRPAVIVVYYKDEGGTTHRLAM